MVKRVDEPFDPFDNDVDLFNVDNLRTPSTDDDDDVPAAKSARRSQSRRSRGGGGVRIGQLIGGLIQAVLIAVLALAIFGALGFGVAFGGQQLGLLPTRPPRVEEPQAVAAVPTQPPQQAAPTQGGSAPTSAPAQGVAAPTQAPPTATPDQGCAAAAPWWNSSQVQQTYQYFLTTAISDARGSDRIPALLDSMNIKSSFVANFHSKDFQDDACVDPVRNDLVSGFNEIMNAVRSVQTSDEAGVTQHQANADKSFAQATADLWALNVNVDADAPPSVGVAQGSGASCGAQDWYSSTKTQLDAFFSTGNQINVNSQPNEVRAKIDNMNAIQANIATATTPACVSKPQTILLNALASDVAYYQQLQTGSNGDTQRSAFEQKYRLFNAWMAWLGVS